MAQGFRLYCVRNYSDVQSSGNLIMGDFQEYSRDLEFFGNIIIFWFQFLIKLIVVDDPNEIYLYPKILKEKRRLG